MEDRDKSILWIIGYIDSHGAIHYSPVKVGESDKKTHDALWPTQHHKRWRFLIREWELDNSPLSKENLTETEAIEVVALVRKNYKPPLWVVEGEEWEALGRPRAGKAYEKHCQKWDEIYKR